ncbi:hypothetical protein N7G274_008326 [Stereocaulon virgatum]|uniref:Orotidine 5'-phosphate decarboxylase n=1 Tax=Stereocaulon virgatum TaxID=373712 RepID=A0ABR4A1Z9_9LECA
MASKSHSTLILPFADRAELPNTPSLATYLLSLISIKRSNLCVSADVYTTYDLFTIAEEVGDYICVLKTHADIIDDFSERTIKGLQEIAERKRFLLFEDRKLGDIGNTVQSQYTRGPLAIATWAHLTNAHLLPGPAMITALHSAATQTLTSLNQSVDTTISVGTPISTPNVGNDSNPLDSAVTTTTTTSDSVKPAESSASRSSSETLEPQTLFSHHRRKGRADSLTMATTTISQTFESTSPRQPASLIHAIPQGDNDAPHDKATALEKLGPPPHARGLLLLAEMSSVGNLMTKEYTQACVKAARDNRQFVLGFVSQRSLNSEADDMFLSFAPGVGLPGEGEADGVIKSDGKGQQWRSPKEVIGTDGIDVIIVGRGILGQVDRAKEAERYRKAAWEAYEGRIAGR